MVRSHLCFLVASIALISGCQKKVQVVQRPVPKVEAATAFSATIPLFLEGIGHVKAFNSVEIKSQVEGRLMEVYYDQGSVVHENQLLLTIDPRPYKAQLAEAEGTLLESKANLKFAEEKVSRYTKLVEDEFVSKLNYDEYTTNVQALLGAIKKNEGAVANAKVNLDYCYIKAPFTGRVGRRLVDKGNVVANDGATLVTLNQIQPIYVDFSLPEKDLSSILARRGQASLVVEAYIPEKEPIKERGMLVVIDNTVDTSTGMIPLRAQFANERELMWPGQFAKVRYILEEKHEATLVPEEAIVLTQKGNSVWVIDATNKATLRAVKVGEKLGGVWEILEGIQPGEKVITVGQINVRSGDVVEITKLQAGHLDESRSWK